MLEAAGNDADNSRPALTRVHVCSILVLRKRIYCGINLLQEAGHELNNGRPVSVGPAASSRSSVFRPPASCHKLSESADRDQVAG